MLTSPVCSSCSGWCKYRERWCGSMQKCMKKKRWSGKGFIKQMVCPATPLRPCHPATHFSEILREKQLALYHWQSCFSYVVKLMLGCCVSFYRVTTDWLLVASHNSCLTGVPNTFFFVKNTYFSYNPAILLKNMSWKSFILKASRGAGLSSFKFFLSEMFTIGRQT